jgi:hypothetical protein
MIKRVSKGVKQMFVVGKPTHNRIPAREDKIHRSENVVLGSTSMLVMEASLEKKAETILQSIHGLLGSWNIPLEEGTIRLASNGRQA